MTNVQINCHKILEKKSTSWHAGGVTPRGFSLMESEGRPETARLVPSTPSLSTLKIKVVKI
jgi:hypothetical protein